MKCTVTGSSTGLRRWLPRLSEELMQLTTVAHIIYAVSGSNHRTTAFSRVYPDLLFDNETQISTSYRRLTELTNVRFESRHRYVSQCSSGFPFHEATSSESIKTWNSPQSVRWWVGAVKQCARRDPEDTGSSLDGTALRGLPVLSDTPRGVPERPDQIRGKKRYRERCVMSRWK